MIIPGSKVVNLSIIIPTYNESANIVNLIDQVEKHLPRDARFEILIVDDNSPDGTGDMVEEYVESKVRTTEWKERLTNDYRKSP
jgi:dolichol-phosphate mannosyltransferase